VGFEIIYVLTSEGLDRYSVMTRISAATARMSNPRARIVVACDHATLDALQQKNDPILNEVDETVAYDTDFTTPTHRNRDIKVRLRLLRDGDFMFLDSDTVVRDCIGSVWEEYSFDVAGCRNHCRLNKGEQIFSGDLDVLDQMNWQPPVGDYLNGGVLFYRDTHGSRDFATHWHKRWMECQRKIGSFRDQPALSKALSESSAVSITLGEPYNAQLHCRLEYDAESEVKYLDWDASIWHYYNAIDRTKPITLFGAIVTTVLADAKLDQGSVARLVRNRHPWLESRWIDPLFVPLFRFRRRLGYGEESWLMGQSRAAIRQWCWEWFGV